MQSLLHTLVTIFVVSLLLMLVVGYYLATLTLRPIERALSSQKMFVSYVSHELLLDAKRMSEIIVGLLNVTRAEYDASQIKMEPIRVDELLMDVSDELMRAHPDYHINISFEGEPESDEEVTTVANRYLLSLAFHNLIENNCKYSADHTSDVSICTSGHLTITFADKGIGMTDEEQRNLFKMFYRGSGHNVAVGHGIGMAIVQRIVTLHKARIDVKSKAGHSTRFFVEFTR